MGLSFNFGKKPETKSETKANSSETSAQDSPEVKKEEQISEKKDEDKPVASAGFAPRIEIKHAVTSPALPKAEIKKAGIVDMSKTKMIVSQFNEKTGGLGVRIVLMLIFGFGAMVAYTGNNYTAQFDNLNGKLPQGSDISQYESYESMLTDILPIDKSQKYISMPKSGIGVQNTINDIIGAKDISYIKKIKILTEIFNSIVGEFNQKKSQIDLMRADITTYGFYDREIDGLLGDGQSQISIQRSLLSLEAIKFSTAMKVFSMLNTFLEQMSRYSGNSVKDISDKISVYTKRGENDIEKYLQACYLNPFEDIEKCSYINDFDNYYDLYEPRSNMDKAFFKKLMSFIDQKLSENSFPSLSLTFDKFDPQSKNISFKLLVNTFQEDELDLIKKGIVSPHIFVITNAINLLKQSKFILGKDINIDDLKIQSNEVEIGGKTFVVHTSSRSFNVPLQEEVQREIYDNIVDLSVFNVDMNVDNSNKNLDKYGTENKSSSAVDNINLQEFVDGKAPDLTPIDTGSTDMPAGDNQDSGGIDSLLAPDTSTSISPEIPSPEIPSSEVPSSDNLVPETTVDGGLDNTDTTATVDSGQLAN